MNRILSSRWTKAVLFVLCLVPAAMLAGRAYHNDLGANPIEYVTHKTGDWTIRFLLITLSVTPLRKLLNLPKLARFRRMLGLFAFFYGCLHLMTWVWFDKFFDVHEMWKDVVKRRFITVGMTAFLMLVPLAITSTAGWVRRLGFVRWQRLHRLVYFAALAGVIHYYWLVKSDVRLPLMYGAIWAILMAYRLTGWVRSNRSLALAANGRK
jgi:sulfoxide reductase heme-binding subunit YedZ